ncbi:MAG: HD family phosphohydrolase [Microcystaceae cyanobacterium]
MKHFPDWQHRFGITMAKSWHGLRHRQSSSVDPIPPASVSPAKKPAVVTSLGQRLQAYPPLRRFFPPMMGGVAILSLTGLVGYRFYNQPQLSVDSIAPSTIIAPYSAEFIDQETTEEKRKAVRTGLTPRLQRDEALTQALQRYREELLTQINHRRSGGDLSPQNGSPPGKALPSSRPAPVGIPHGETLPGATLGMALQLQEKTWKATQSQVIQISDRILTQGLPQGLPPHLLRETIQQQLSPQLPPSAQTVAQDILLTLLADQHNLSIDREATQQQAEQAVLAVQAIAVTVKRGETIVKAGEKITQSQFVLLDGFGLSQRGINWEGLGLTAGLVTGAVVIFWGVSQRVHRPLRRRDYFLLCLLSLSSPLMVFLHPRYNDLPAIGLLVGSFYGPSLAVSQVALVGGLSLFAIEGSNWEYLLAGLGAGLLAGWVSGKLRSRDDLARLGVGVGIVQGGIYLVNYLVMGSLGLVVWSTVIPGALIFGLLGMAWVIVAIGLSPYLERIFDVVTPIRLVELANPNCPLLQRLAKEAPGTFQHTLFVACLAESAARELRCNVELVRAGTLYHDIGKMHDPLGFIENQMGGVNKHDEINDPYQSADIIKKHVTLGLAMGQQYGLPQVVRDFIPEHQGTLLISYFYYQAKEQAEKQGLGINEQDFRYDGPIPQSRETGIVMLADSAEAALRSLKDTDVETAKVMVNRIFKARWRDGQLQQSGLKYEELPIIAGVFVQVWQQFHHQRIAYPKAALEARPTVISGTGT